MQGIDEKVVALIGDGALTGGLALEGLNNAGASHSDLLIILNDNNCSIDKNIGGLHDYLLKLTTDPTYNKLKDKIWDKMGDGWLRGKMQNLVRSTKSSLVDGFGGALFESLGFRYFGPIDGNDIDAVLNALKRLRNIKGPRILHAITTKGKGYGPAEQILRYGMHRASSILPRESALPATAVRTGIRTCSAMSFWISRERTSAWSGLPRRWRPAAA